MENSPFLVFLSFSFGEVGMGKMEILEAHGWVAGMKIQAGENTMQTIDENKKNL